jgi:hypothetical protein
MGQQFRHQNRHVNQEFGNAFREIGTLKMQVADLLRNRAALDGLLGGSATHGEVLRSTIVGGTRQFGFGVGGSVVSTIFIVDFTTTGAISGEAYESGTDPANKVFTAVTCDDDNLTVHVEVDAGTSGGVGQGWQPVVTIRGGDADVEITNLTPIVGSTRRFSGSATISASQSATIYADVDDGGRSQDVAYTRTDDPPLVLTAVIDNHSTTTGGDAECPYAQTQVSEDDTLDISGTAEPHAEEVYVIDEADDQNICRGEGVQGPFTVTAGVWSGTINVGTGSHATAHYKCYAKVTGGTAGTTYTSDETIDKDQTAPNLALSGIVYPGTQEALKDAENAQITVTDSNRDAGDTTVWADPESHFDDGGTMAIASSEANVDAGSYDNTSWDGGVKWVERQSGDYWESGTNATVTATRVAKNGKAQTLNITVKIAHVAPVVTVARNTGGSALNRMGSGSGPKSHTVYLISSQANLSTSSPALTPDAGDTAAFIGSWATNGDLRYTRSFQVEDGDINAGGQANNNFTWASCLITNRAGKTATTVTTNTTYSLGGFTARTVNMGPITGGDPPYTHTGDIGVPIVDTSKTTVVNTSKGGTPAQTYEGNVTEHNDADSSLNNYWTTVAALASEVFDDYTQNFHCSDKRFYDSVTAPAGFNCTVAESET